MTNAEKPAENRLPTGWLKIRHSVFCIRWLWQHRGWQDTKQKYRQMEKEWRVRLRG